MCWPAGFANFADMFASLHGDRAWKAGWKGMGGFAVAFADSKVACWRLWLMQETPETKLSLIPSLQETKPFQTLQTRKILDLQAQMKSTRMNAAEMSEKEQEQIWISEVRNQGEEPAQPWAFSQNPTPQTCATLCNSCRTVRSSCRIKLSFFN